MRTSLLSADELATHTPAQGMPSPLLPPELPPQTPLDLPPETSPPPAEGGSEEIKLPWGILLLVYGVLMSDAIASTVITPFVPDMCSKRFGISEENVGMAAGALIGAYNLASFVSSFMLGHLADKYGRKLIVMGGLLSGAVGTILFGFSPNFALAFASRLLAGFFNANIAVARAVCADVTEGQARILAFAYTAACFNLSRSLSSGIGGAFTIIDFSGVPMLADNPFLFPCLVGGAFNFVSLLTVLFFLPETSKRVQEHQQGKSKQSLREGLKSFKDWLMTKLIFTYSIGSFCNGGLLVAMVLFYSLQVEHRGLGFDPLLNGLAFALFSTTGFFFQIFAFERMLKWLGVVNLYLLSSLLLCLGVLLLPCVTFIYWGLGVNTVSTVLVWIALAVIVCCLLATGFMCFLSTLSAMVSNACEDSIQGLTMGMNQSVSSLLRALGPFVVGMVFSAGVAIKFPFFGFWILGVLYFCCFLLLFWLSPLERFRVGDTSAALADLKSKAAEGEAENRPLLKTVTPGER